MATGDPEPSIALAPWEASGTGFHAHRAGAVVASFTAVRALGAGCVEAIGTKASIKPPP
jgi:hypothetical protein